MASKRSSPWRIVLCLLIFICGSRCNIGLQAGDGTFFQNTVVDLESSALEKRITAFDTAVTKGISYIKLMECPNTPQSVFTDQAALFDNGWCDHLAPHNTPPRTQPNGNPPSFGTVNAVYKGLSLSMDLWEKRSYYSWWHEKGDYGAIQETTSAYGPFRSGTEFRSTGGRYENVFIPEAGMIICYNDFSPSYMVAQTPGLVLADVPPLNRHSDVLWLQWKNSVEWSGQNELVSNMKWIWQYQVVDKTSKEVIDTVISMPNEALQGWPGRTYEMSEPFDSQEGSIARALLGTPNGVGVAHFLCQHWAELGKKVVSKVQLWEGRRDRHLLFYIIETN
ncbi:Mitochondrial import inner membrane translocase subunit tim8 [Elasticomyces elasticus]|nr:Mitochondrial import inner membrane translocase subunit tim8 [Elasticomyces elasticus]KAK3638994.1 Mitochondrial import inner membrane translocase subunit tim8 [Elasticomyces elasticus]KAK4918752.1 Mitochondrial import inner membrane translocase subunit tim8 [Elasticomyces elasticus]KAK5754419.1 Mitochondrial import inner membrane translocase subunit tim8 [Elasticomyces elasticus]